jgi:hypothetical protein
MQTAKPVPEATEVRNRHRYLPFACPEKNCLVIITRWLDGRLLRITSLDSGPI